MLHIMTVYIVAPLVSYSLSCLFGECIVFLYFSLQQVCNTAKPLNYKKKHYDQVASVEQTMLVDSCTGVQQSGFAFSEFVTRKFTMLFPN